MRSAPAPSKCVPSGRIDGSDVPSGQSTSSSGAIVVPVGARSRGPHPLHRLDASPVSTLGGRLLATRVRVLAVARRHNCDHRGAGRRPAPRTSARRRVRIRRTRWGRRPVRRRARRRARRRTGPTRRPPPRPRRDRTGRRRSDQSRCQTPSPPHLLCASRPSMTNVGRVLIGASEQGAVPDEHTGLHREPVLTAFDAGTLRERRSLRVADHEHLEEGCVVVGSRRGRAAEGPATATCPVSPVRTGSAPTVAAKVPTVTTSASITTADRARRGERRRTPRRIGPETSRLVTHDSATTTASRSASSQPPSSDVRCSVRKRYVGQCHRYISYEIAPTQRSGDDSRTRPNQPTDGCVRRHNTTAVATEYASRPKRP